MPKCALSLTFSSWSVSRFCAPMITFASSQYTAYVILCSGNEGQRWTIKKRFRQFREFRMTLIKAGASPLKTVSFPRKTVGKSKEKTDTKRQSVLQTWLNLVVSVYSGQPAFAPHIVHFLDLDIRDPTSSLGGEAPASGGVWICTCLNL